MPCKPTGKTADTCGAGVARPSKAVQLGGKAGQAYDVTLRFRGVVELMSYGGGQADNFWYAGGKPSDKKFGVYELQVSSPASPTTQQREPSCDARGRGLHQDPARHAGATLTLPRPQDSMMVPTGISRITPRSSRTSRRRPPPFDGQFLQIGDVGVAPARSGLRLRTCDPSPACLQASEAGPPRLQRASVDGCAMLPAHSVF
jgi:hypothetical protein